MSGARLERAVAAFLRQELGSSVAAIMGFLDILIEDAQREDLGHCVSDLERMRAAARQLSATIDRVAARSGSAGDAWPRLRHDLRTPLNAIKGYGELLVEEADEGGRQYLVADLAKVLELSDRLIGEIDRIAEAAAMPTLGMVGDTLEAIRPLERAEGAEPGAASAHVLVVDDNASNRDLLSRQLRRQGYRVSCAAGGAAALHLVEAEPFDLVLLDLMMPGMGGFELLHRLKVADGTRHIPVVMISALDEIDSAVRCIEAGAEDYLPKPFNAVLLRARIGACLERKRLLDELRLEKERSEALLLNTLPRRVVERMRRGETPIADQITEATILFSDLVDFSSLAATLSPRRTVELLGSLFSEFDALAARHGLEKIKTIGDGYMAAAGLPETRTDHAAAAAELALAMLDTTAAGRSGGIPLQLRIGLNTGPIVAGVIGRDKFVYDVWGDTVNTAKRMETLGLPGRVHLSAATRRVLDDRFECEPRGPIDVKGKGQLETYLLRRSRYSLAPLARRGMG